MPKQRQVVSAPLPKAKQRTRAKQIGGMPAYQTPNLYAAHMPAGTHWLLVPPDEDHLPGVAVGMNVTVSGLIPFAPIPLPQMRMSRLVVVVESTSDFEDEQTHRGAAEVSFYLLYLSHESEFHKQTSVPLIAIGDRFAFEVPLEHLDRNDLLSLSIGVTLLNDKPVLLRGVWLEIEGL